MYSSSIVFNTNNSVKRKVSLRNLCKILFGDPDKYNFAEDILDYKSKVGKFSPVFMFNSETEMYDFYIVYLISVSESPNSVINIVVMDTIIRDLIELSGDNVKISSMSIVHNKL